MDITFMKTLKKLAVGAVLALIAWVSVALVVAQSVRIDGDQFFQSTGRDVVRLWQDYTLRPGETAEDVVVISGSTKIGGEVQGDVVTVLGSVDLEGTAVIRGSLVVIGGDATIADGARVERDLTVIGGVSTIPVAFHPGGEHVVIGGAWVGQQLRAIVPWITRGLIWGRLIVPSLGWMWGFLAMMLILTLAIDLLLHGPVGQCADAIAARPASTFLTGLLVLLLTAPISVVLAATVVGLAVVPFFIAAVVLAWIVGKVGVKRWIGRSIFGHDPAETRAQGLRDVCVGFVAIALLYMVPVVGIVTWALVGVFGLGSAALTILRAVRRERPRPAPAVRPAAPVAPSEDAVPPPPPSPPPAPAIAFQSVPPPPVTAPPIASAGPIGFGSAEVPASALLAFPRATFVDRLMAGALDVALVMFAFNVFFRGFLFRHDADAQLFVLFAYFVLFWAWRATTVGGIVCGLRVVRVDGRPLAGGDAIIRGLASLFSFVPLGIGFFWILRDPLQQAWHDKIAGTYVVKVDRNVG